MSDLAFSVYSVKNENSNGVNVFLGIASKKTTTNNTIDYFPHKVVSCKSTYLFASIVGTRNVKVTRPTTTDPYIYLETRKVNPVRDGIEATSFLKSGDSSGIVLRTITSDASIQINDKGCNYGLTTLKYDVQNACSINGLFYQRSGTPGESDVVWQFKEIVGVPPFINVSDSGGTITISFNNEACCSV
jgi:hypothetical protein